MMENRSFDHMLGYLSKEGHSDGTQRPDVDGLHRGEKNRFKERDFQSFALTDTVFIESPCHSRDCVDNQVDAGKMDGVEQTLPLITRRLAPIRAGLWGITPRTHYVLRCTSARVPGLRPLVLGAPGADLPQPFLYTDRPA